MWWSEYIFKRGSLSVSEVGECARSVGASRIKEGDGRAF